MIEAVENHNPEVIVIDEIGREREAEAARTINERGVQLIGTAHGNSLENLMLNPTLSDLIGGIESVTLSDEEARRRGTQKTVLERRAPPTFDILIEIQARQHLCVHRDVADAVDNMLRGRPLAVENRTQDSSGEVHIESEDVVPENTTVTGRRAREQRELGESGGRSSRSAGQGGSGNGSANVRGRERESAARAQPTLVGAPKGEKLLNVFAYGVARNRLQQAAKRLGVFVNVVEELHEADVLVTLKSYYRRRRKTISEAEQRRTPIYVLRANTINQMEGFIAEALNLESVPTDPFESAIADAERAIALIQEGEDSVDLRPVGSAMRRYQHQPARQANLVSHSYGKEPNRHVRIFSSSRNVPAMDLH
jgi:hypothetical protein